MLHEIPYVRQIPGKGRRRWFSDAYFDLVVWYAGDGTVRAFQLRYDKHEQERAFTWRKGHRCVHQEIDTGEWPGHSETSPVLRGRSAVPTRGLERRFFWECGSIDDRALVRLVCDTISRCLLAGERGHARRLKSKKQPVERRKAG